jgi:hypothetical protein
MADALYDQDFYLWTQDQARRLRALDGDNRLDTQHLAEEVADLGRSELNKVASHLYQAFVHILLAAWSPGAQQRAAWRGEVRGQLRGARRAFTPGMRQHLDLDREWRDAWALAGDKLAAFDEPGLPAESACPFALDELLDPQVEVDGLIQRAADALRDAGTASGT